MLITYLTSGEKHSKLFFLATKDIKSLKRNQLNSNSVSKNYRVRGYSKGELPRLTSIK